MQEITKLLETDIKALVLNKLFSSKVLTHDTTVISELNVEQFSRRVDLALVKHNSLTAFEIKSESDSLVRLEGQVETYLKYFDKVIVVAATKHIDNVLKVVPKHVGVWSISQDKIVIKQRGRKKQITSAQSYLELMTVGELTKLSNRLKLHNQNKYRAGLEASLANSSIEVLRAYAINSVARRYLSTSFKFYNAIKDRGAKPADIELLSKYKHKRNAIKLKSEDIRNAWRDFNLKSKQDLYSEAFEFKTNS